MPDFMIIIKEHDKMSTNFEETWAAADKVRMNAEHAFGAYVEIYQRIKKKYDLDEYVKIY